MHDFGRNHEKTATAYIDNSSQILYQLNCAVAAFKMVFPKSAKEDNVVFLVSEEPNRS